MTDRMLEACIKEMQREIERLWDKIRLLESKIKEAKS